MWRGLWVFPIVVQSFVPLVGIVAEPRPDGSAGSYVPSSYIKWVESLGGQPVALPYDSPEALHDAGKVHGILFPGGDSKIQPSTLFGKFSFEVFKIALVNLIPVWGTCLGFEQVLLYTHAALGLAGAPIALVPSASEAVAAPFNLTAAGRTHPWWTGLRQESRETLQNEPVLMYFHHSGFSLSDFVHSSAAQVWDALSVNADRHGEIYVATVAMRDYPVWATQFHPEKNAFEHHSKLTPPGQDVPAQRPEAIEAMADLGRDFMRAARRRPWEKWTLDTINFVAFDQWTQTSYVTTAQYAFDSVYLIPPWKTRKPVVSELFS